MSTQGVTITVNAESGAAAEQLQRFFSNTIAGFDHRSGATRFLEELAGKIVAVLSVTAIVEFTREAINAAEAMGTLSRQVGFSLSSLSALKEQANENGIRFEELRLGLTHFNSVLNEARQNGGQAMQSFRNLSEEIAVAVMQGRPAEDVYRMIAERFKQMPDGIQKTAAAVAMFGRDSGKWVTQLNEGAEVIDRIKQEGGPITAEAVANATAFNRTLREWKESAEIFVQTVVADIMPALLRLQTIPALISNAWKDDKLPEIIGLMIEAGLELGAIAIKKIWVTTWNALTSASAGQIYMTLINAVMSFGVAAAKFLIKVLAEPIIFMSAGFDWLGSHLKEIFTDAINFFIKEWDRVVTKLPGGDKVKLSLIDSSTASTFEESLRDMRNFIEPLFKGANDYLTDSLEKSREVLGIAEKLSDADDTHAGALKRLIGLMDEQLKKAESIHKIITSTPPASGVAGTAGDQDKIKAAHLQSNRDLIQLQEQVIQTDPTLTQTQRLQKLLPLLVQEKGLINEQIAEQKAIAKDPSRTELERVAANREIIKLQLQQLQLSRQLVQAAHPWATAMGEAAQKLKDMNNLAQETAQSFQNVFNTAISSISDNLTKVIQGTETWGQALRNIGSAILNEIISSIVQMAVRWVITSLMMAAFGEALIASTAALYSAAWAGPAILSTIASYGASAEAAGPEVMTALAFTPMVAAAAREHGGPMDAGGLYMTGERGRELVVPKSASHVFNADDTARLVSMSRNNSKGSMPSAPTVNLRVHFQDDPQRTAKEVRDNPSIHHVIVDVAKRNAHIIQPRA